jgi:hypothetical protein
MEQDHIRRAEASVIESIDIENMLDAQNDGRSFFLPTSRGMMQYA